MDLSILSGPVIGAIIGYGTNWIAIKMLFRPLKPVKIGKFTLPFTPGIISKRKDELAKAVGNSVGNNLFTYQDIQKMLLTEETENAIINSILEKLQSDETIKSSLLELIDEKEYRRGKEKIELMVSRKIKEGLLACQLGEIIANEGGQVIRDKVKSSMLKMFVTDGLIDSIVAPVGMEVEKYIEENGQDKILPVVQKELISLENQSIKELMENFQIEKLELENVIREIYRKFILEYVNHWLVKLDISKVVEDKINQMNVSQLEKLILSIMKKELGAIVNLGALIGLILGTVNIFI